MVSLENIGNDHPLATLYGEMQEFTQKLGNKI